MGGEQNGKAQKGELYEGPEGKGGRIVGQKALDAEEKKGDRNNEGGRKVGISEEWRRRRGQQRES